MRVRSNTISYPQLQTTGQGSQNAQDWGLCFPTPQCRLVAFCCQLGQFVQSLVIERLGCQRATYQPQKEDRSFLKNLEYADDICLFSHRLANLNHTALILEKFDRAPHLYATGIVHGTQNFDPLISGVQTRYPSTWLLRRRKQHPSTCTGHTFRKDEKSVANNARILDRRRVGRPKTTQSGTVEEECGCHAMTHIWANGNHIFQSSRE